MILHIYIVFVQNSMLSINTLDYYIHSLRPFDDDYDVDVDDDDDACP